MEFTLLFLGVVLAVAGLLGCIIPGVPGPPLNFISVLLVQWATGSFSIIFLVTWGVITAGVIVLDYLLPIWTARRFGATRLGIIGSLTGMLLGIFFTPIGMLGGLIVGAIAGDMIAGRSHAEAARSGMATFFGTLMSIGMKLIVSGALSWYAVRAIIQRVL